MDPQFVQDAVATATADISTALSGSLPTILVVVASLIGLSLLIRLIRRYTK